MNKFQKFYAFLGVILVGLLAYYMISNSKVKKAKKKAQRFSQEFRKFKVVAEQVYQHQETIRMNKGVLEERSKGDLEMTNVLKLIKKHNLKTPSNYSSDIFNKRTYREKRLSLMLKDEKLKDIIKFLIDVEKLGDSNVKNITFTRDPKNKDIWNSSLAIVKIVPKED